MPSPQTGPSPPSPGGGATVPDFGWSEAALLVGLAVFWGVAYVFIREGIVLGASPLAFASVRYFLSAAAFGALALARREPLASRRSLWVSAVVGGVMIIGVYGGLLYWGEQYTTGGYASVLSATAPLLTVLAAFFLLPNERLGALALGGLGVGFAGVVLLVAPTLFGSSAGVWPGPLFVVAAFVMTATGSVLLRRLKTGAQSLGQIGLQFAVAGLLLGGASLLVPGSRAFPLTEGVLGSLAVLVLVSSVMGYFVYFRLHHRVGPVRSNIVTYLIPLVGVGVGSGFLGEPVNVWEIVGFVVIASGVTLLLLGSRRRS